MFKNYIIIAFRNLVRNKIYSVINITGLAIGMVCSILILWYVQYELSYDKYHKNQNNIYRVTREHKGPSEQQVFNFASIGPPFAEGFKKSFSEIEHAVRFTRGGDVIEYKEKIVNESRIYFSDSEVFDVFSFTMLKGNPKTALIQPYTAIITESTAKKYFVDEDPINKVIRYGNQYPVTITGVVKDVPDNSHFRFDFLLSYSTLESTDGDAMRSADAWQWNTAATYLLLNENTDAKNLEQKLNIFLVDNVKDNRTKFQKLRLQRLTDIHLYSQLSRDMGRNGDIRQIYLFSCLAFLILLIACINFINLSTARSAKRALEVGIRKTLGVKQSQLIIQFFSESIVQVLLALLIAILLIEIVSPVYSNLFANNIQPLTIFNGVTLIELLGLIALVGIFAGVYPAFYLSSFQPIAILKKNIASKSGGNISLRKILITLQFTIAIALITSVTIIRQQMKYINTKDLGFDKEQIILLPVNEALMSNYESFKDELRKHSSVVNVCGTWGTPITGNGGIMGPVYAEIKGKMVQQTPGPNFTAVDYDFIPTYQLQLIAGSNFPRKFLSDSLSAFVLNELAVKTIGWQSPQEAIGKNFQYTTIKGKIVGVVKDFHNASLHEKIIPLVMFMRKEWVHTLGVKIKNDNAISYIEGVWKSKFPNYPFEYSFLEDYFNNAYRSEKDIERLLNVFALLGIFITCIGLLGLVAYTTEQRTKEIGIRKIMGASVPGIISLILKDFLKLILFAAIVSIPVIYYIMNKWLEGFAYHVTITPAPFVIAGVITLLIAIATICFHAFKASMANPVNALRYE